MTWREHIAGVLGAVIVLVVLTALAIRPLLLSLDLNGGFSTTVAKSASALRNP